MSFREVRSLLESLRTLGYPHPLSHECFKTPNFAVCADILSFLARRYDPLIDVPFDPTSDTTESQRVAFTKNICSLLLSRARIRFNMRRFYAADSNAVPELLKLTQLLTLAYHDENMDSDTASQITTQKLPDLTSLGASLYSLLGAEAELRSVRTRSLSKPLDLEEVQLTIRQRIEKAKTTIDQLRKELSVQSVDAENLRAKIDKKKAEVDRTDKRLKSLETVRPAFMDEFEKLEEELANLVSLYAARKRNVGWLKSMVEDSKKREAERAGGRNEWAEMREKMKNEERETLIGGGAMAGAGGVNVVGSLTAEGDDDDSDVSDVTGEDEDEDDDDDDQDDDSGLGMGTGLDRSGRRRGLHGDDDDELDDADLEGLDDEDSDSDGNGGDARGLGSESESESVVFDEDDGSAESDDF